MPIIVMIVSGLAFWALYWFVQMGGIEHYQQRRKAREDDAKRAAAREASRLAPLRAVDDPRDAAAILMLLIARANGDPTRERIALIENKLRTVFGFERELTERMTQARFLAQQTESFEKAAGVFADMFRKRLTREERQELVEMLEEVARNELPYEREIEAITAFRPKIGLAAAI